MTAAVDPKPDLPALTGIRGIAAWFVVLYHIRGGAASQMPGWLTASFAKGYLAVDLFFMLSGFVLWLNYADRLRGKGIGAAPQFLARRIARIWPLHIFILGCAVLFALALSLTGRADPDRYPWSELPLHILLVQNWGFTERLSWNDPAWSISCEFAAYLLFPLLALSIDWRRFPTPALLGAIGLLALGLHIVMAASGAADLGSDIPRFGIVRALFQFGIGTVICALWFRWRAAPRLPLIAGTALAAVLTFVAVRGLLPETLAVPLLFAALLTAVALSAASPRNPLGWRPIHYLGEISYATYLVHFLLYVLFKLIFVDDAASVSFPLLGLFLLLTFVASVLLHHGIERPSQRLLNRAYDAGFRPLAGRPAA